MKAIRRKVAESEPTPEIKNPATKLAKAVKKKKKGDHGREVHKRCVHIIKRWKLKTSSKPLDLARVPSLRSVHELLIMVPS